MALPKTTKLTLENVHQNFKDYNFIISLKGMTIDTSEFVQSFHHNGQIVGITTSSKFLYLTDSERDLSHSSVEAKENCLILFDDSVESIKVKSKRNFLLNQSTKA